MRFVCIHSSCLGSRLPRQNPPHSNRIRCILKLWWKHLEAMGLNVVPRHFPFCLIKLLEFWICQCPLPNLNVGLFQLTHKCLEVGTVFLEALPQRSTLGVQGLFNISKTVKSFSFALA